MTEFLILLALIAAFFLLRRRFGFRAQSPEDYAETLPHIDLRQHLNGPIDCEGAIFGPTGRVTSRFVARMDGRWTNTTGTLTEGFTYDSGTTQSREWTLYPGQNGNFTATAPDIIGTAEGVVSGATIRMTYRIRLPQNAGGYVLDVTDWLYLTSNGVMVNRSEMRKFGIKVAELVATMRPADMSAAA
ncbi:DUF3833 domain-containing protein [Shimia biformata]|uniref:DUF3833 domain-containing protein n=1 Tax=Shimia biformata TaxID=1294299 RepID=UPI001952289F|nr:DUF3833 domain-containing protein [Shimia biformata]